MAVNWEEWKSFVEALCATQHWWDDDDDDDGDGDDEDDDDDDDRGLILDINKIITDQ